MSRAHLSSVTAAAVVVCAALLAACGDDDDGDSVAAEPAAEESTDDGDAAAEASGDTGDGDAPESNACPPEGCEIVFSAVEADGDELSITWTANFLPDVARNHIHIYWDTYTADEVSSDAEARGSAQGDWLPTDAFPVLVTEGAVSVANRADSTTLCATAADRDHAVLDSSIVDCIDVTDALS